MIVDADRARRRRGRMAAGERRPHRTRGGALGRPRIWFALPCLVVFAVVVIIPALQGVAYSFTSWTGIGSAIQFIGLTNYVQIFQTPEALGALGHTVLIAAVVTVGQNVVGLLLALAVNSRIKSRLVLRTVLFAPVVMTPVIVGYMWQFLYEPDGVIAGALSALVGHRGGEINFLGDPHIAIWSVIVVIIWQHAGYAMAIFLAGLQSVPDEVREAAALDGAGPVRMFWPIIRPFLRTALVVNVTLALVMSLKTFDQVIALTQGGPDNATQTISSLLYNEAFLFSRYGFGMSLAVSLFVLVFGVAYLQLRTGRLREEPTQ